MQWTSRMLQRLHPTSITNNTTTTSTTNAFSTHATLTTAPFQIHQLRRGPAESVQVTREEARVTYRDMCRWRCIDTQLADLYVRRRLRDFKTVCEGREALAVGIATARHPDDLLVAQRADWTALVGKSAEEVFRQLMGTTPQQRSTSPALQNHPLFGPKLSLSILLSFAEKPHADQNVCYSIYDQRMANSPRFAENVRTAANWTLPVVFVCEGGGKSAVFKRDNFVSGIFVDATDVLAVRNAAKFARDHCADGNGPLVLEYSAAPPNTSDPLRNFEQKLTENGLCSESELKEISGKVEEEVSEAVDAVIESAPRTRRAPTLMEHVLGTRSTNQVAVPSF